MLNPHALRLINKGENRVLGWRYRAQLEAFSTVKVAIQ